MGRDAHDLGIVRRRFAWRHTWGLAGTALLFILAGATAAELVSALSGRLPMTAGLPMYAGFSLFSLALGFGLCFIYWLCTAQRVKQLIATNLVSRDLLLRSLLNDNGEVINRAGYGYGYKGSRQDSPAVQLLTRFIRHYARLGRSHKLCPYPWEQSRRLSMLQGSMYVALMLLIVGSILLAMISSALQITIPDFIQEGRWVPGLVAILLFGYAMTVGLHTLIKNMLAGLVLATVRANPNEFRSLLTAGK